MMMDEDLEVVRRSCSNLYVMGLCVMDLAFNLTAVIGVPRG